MSDSEAAQSVSDSSDKEESYHESEDDSGYGHIVWLEEDDDNDALPPLMNSSKKRQRNMENFRAHPRMYGNTHRCKEFPHGVYIDEYGEIQPDHPRSNIFWKRSEWIALHPEHASELNVEDTGSEEEFDSDHDVCEDDPARSSDDEDEQYWKAEEEKIRAQKKEKKKSKKRKRVKDEDYETEEEEEDEDDFCSEELFSEDEDSDYSPPPKRKKKGEEGNHPEKDLEDVVHNTLEDDAMDIDEDPKEAKKRAHMEKILSKLKEDAATMEHFHKRGQEQKALYLQSQKLNRKMDEILSDTKAYFKTLKTSYHTKDIPRISEWNSCFLSSNPFCTLTLEWKRKGVKKVELQSQGLLESFKSENGHEESSLPKMVLYLIQNHLPSLTPMKPKTKKKPDSSNSAPFSMMPPSGQPMNVIPASMVQSIFDQAAAAANSDKDEESGDEC